MLCYNRLVAMRVIGERGALLAACLPVLLLTGCSGPRLVADPAWTPAVVFVTPTVLGGEAGPLPTPLAIPTAPYQVRAGETLTVIAARYGLTVEQLAALNGLSDPNAIEVGQVIRVPRRAP